MPTVSDIVQMMERTMLTMRNQPNFFAAGCAAVLLLVSLLLPVISVAFIPLNGIFLFLINAWYIIPPLLVIGMAVASLLLERKIAIVLGGIWFLLHVVMLIAAPSLLSSSFDGLLGLIPEVGRILQQGTRMLSPALVRISFGGVLSLVLGVVYLVLEVMMSDQSYTMGHTHQASSGPNNEWPRL